jgi:hypothetical protein
MSVTAAGLTRVGPSGALTERACNLPHAVKFDLAGVVVEVRFDNAEAAQLYRGRYRHMLTDCAPQEVGYAAELGPGEIYFWLDGHDAYRWDRSAIKPQVIAFLADAVVNTTVFTSRDGIIALHAAALSDGRAAAAIVGSSTAGKTTTAIACARRGLELYSDEYCIATEAGIIPFPRSISLRCAATEVLANDPVPSSAVDAWLGSHGCCDGYDLGYDELFGVLHRPKPRPLRAAFVLVGKGSQPVVRPLSRNAMLEHIAPWAKLKPRGFEALHALVALLEPVTCFEVVLGTPDATARAIELTLENVSRTEAA